MPEPATIADLIQQGLYHHHRGELALAVQRYSDVLRTDPNNPDALYYVAVIACQEEQFKQGIELGQKALAAGPSQARVHNLIGKAHERLGEHLDAIKAFDAAIAVNPSFAEAHGNRAALLAATGLPGEALKSFDRALALDPQAAADWINRGALLQELGRHEEALTSYDKALALVPGDPSVIINRANALAMLGRFAEAERTYDEALARNPTLVIALAHKGLAVKHQGRFVEARLLLEQALALQPKEPQTAFGLAQIMLLTGDWRPAWPLFEARNSLPHAAYAPLEGPRWRGDRAGDYRLVLLAEQGLGDTVQFARFAALYAGRGYDVTLLAQPVLAPLLRTLPGVERVITRAEELATDKRRYAWLPLLSSMGMLHLTADTVPAPEPYLTAEPDRVANWAGRLGDGFKVGLVWHGETRSSAAPLSALAPLTELEGVRLISLQNGAAAAALKHASLGDRIEQPLAADDLSAEGLLDTAAVMANLDLVVSIDSMPAHLAGALGRPVMLALPYVADWRWLLERGDTIWYADMRLFRQDATRDWQPVFAHIAAAVRERAGG